MKYISKHNFKRKYTNKQVSKRLAKLVYTVTYTNHEYEVCRNSCLSIFDMKRRKHDLFVTKKRASTKKDRCS